MTTAATLDLMVRYKQVQEAEARLNRLQKRVRDLERENKRLQQSVDRTSNSMKNMGRQVDGLAKLFKGLLLTLGVKELISLADTYKLLEGRLKLVTKNSSELQKVQKQLFDISQNTRTSFEGTAELFTRVARNAKELGRSQKDLLSFTDAVQKAIQSSGASAQEAAGGVLQLSQALASGTLAGEEFRSVTENIPGVARAIAEGLGLTIGQLKALSKDGELTADKVLDAMLKMRGQIEKDFASVPVTVGQALTVLSNQFGKIVSEFDKATGTTDILAKGVLLLSNNLEAVLNVALSLGAGGAIAAVTIGMGSLATSIVAATTAAGGFTASLLAMRAALLANPLTAFAVALGAAVAAAIQFRDELGLSSFAQDSYQGAIDRLTESQKDLGDQIASTTQKMREQDIQTVTNSITALAQKRLQVETKLKEIGEVIAGQDPNGRGLGAGPSKSLQKRFESLTSTSQFLTAEIDKLITTLEKLEKGSPTSSDDEGSGGVKKLAKDTEDAIEFMKRLDEELLLGKQVLDELRLGSLETADALRKQGEAVDKARELAEDFNKENKDAIKLNKNLAKTYEDFLDVAEELVKTEEEIDKLEKKIKDTREEAKKVIEDTLTPLEKYEKEQKRLKELLPELIRLTGDQARAQEILNRALKKSTDEYQKAITVAKKVTETELDKIWERAAEGIQDTFTDTFRDIIKNGVDSFEDFGDKILDIIYDVAAEIAAALIFKPVIANILGGIAPGVAKSLLGDAASSGSGFSITDIFSGGKTLFDFIGNGGVGGGGFLNGIGSSITSIGDKFFGIFEGIDAAFGIGNSALPAAPIIPGGSAVPLAGAVAPASLAFVPFLGMGVAAILTALMGRGDGPAFGASFGLENGLLGTPDVRVDDGFSEGAAREIATNTQKLANAFLEGNKLRLRDGAFRGELAYNDGFFKSSAGFRNNAANERLNDVTGIKGLQFDSRLFYQAETAIGDFIARNLFVALQEGNLDGVTTETEDVFRVGLGNIIRQIRDRVVGDNALENLTEDLNFLTAFANAREAFDDISESSNEAAERLKKASESQREFNLALDTVKTNAKKAADEAGSPLQALANFIPNARRLFDPTGGAGVQTRLRLEDRRIGAGFHNRVGGLDVLNATLAEAIFDDNIGGRRLASGVGFNPDAIQRRIEGEGLGNGGKFGTLADTFNFGNLRIRQVANADGDQFSPHSFFGEHGVGGTFDAGGGNFFQVDGAGSENLTVDADKFVRAVVGAGVRFSEVIEDPLFAGGAALILESAQLAVNEVNRFFDSISGAASVDGPLALFEEIVPAVSPIIEQFEGLKAQIEATRPDLEALNEDLEELGVATISADDRINAAIDDLATKAQDQFLGGLGIAVSSDGTIESARVDFQAINALAETVKSLDLNAAELFKDDPRGLLPDVQKEIDKILSDGLSDILSKAEDPAVTLAQIEHIFGGRLGQDMLSTLLQIRDGVAAASEDQIDSDEKLAEHFKQQLTEINDKARNLSTQIQLSEREVDLLKGIAQSFRQTREGFLVNPNLSPLSLQGQLGEAESQFDRALEKYNNAETVEEQAEYQRELLSTSQAFLEASKRYYASSDDYIEDFYKVQDVLNSSEELANSQLSKTEQSLVVAKQQLTQLEAIAEQIGAIVNSDQPLYVQGSDGQYISTGAGGLPAGLDLGKNPTGNIAIYQAFRAAGIGFPGAGEGQLAALRQQNPQADQILRGLGFFANGGIMTSSGAVPLRRYSRGGVANSPQMALFGEGSSPEAFVPLEDGRSIPVTVDLLDYNSNSGLDISRLETLVSVTREAGSRSIQLLRQVVDRLESIDDTLRRIANTLEERLA